MNANTDADPLDAAFAALLNRSPEPPEGLRRQLEATIPDSPRKERNMILRLSLVGAACSALAFYFLRPSLARPVPYTRTVQQMRELPFLHIRFRQRPDVREDHWLTKETWFDQARGLRVGPLSGVASPDEMLLLPNDTLYWKLGTDVMTLRGQGSWKKTYDREMKSVQDFPSDSLAGQAIPAKATFGQWRGRKVYIYNVRLAPGGLTESARLYIDSDTNLLLAQQRTVRVGAQEILKEEYLYDYDTRPDAALFDVARFRQSGEARPQSPKP